MQSSATESHKQAQQRIEKVVLLSGKNLGLEVE